MRESGLPATGTKVPDRAVEEGNSALLQQAVCNTSAMGQGTGRAEVTGLALRRSTNQIREFAFKHRHQALNHFLAPALILPVDEAA